MTAGEGSAVRVTVGVCVGSSVGKRVEVCVGWAFALGTGVQVLATVGDGASRVGAWISAEMGTAGSEAGKRLQPARQQASISMSNVRRSGIGFPVIVDQV